MKVNELNRKTKLVWMWAYTQTEDWCLFIQPVKGMEVKYLLQRPSSSRLTTTHFYRDTCRNTVYPLRMGALFSFPSSSLTCPLLSEDSIHSVSPLHVHNCSTELKPFPPGFRFASYPICLNRFFHLTSVQTLGLLMPVYFLCSISLSP